MRAAASDPASRSPGSESTSAATPSTTRPEHFVGRRAAGAGASSRQKRGAEAIVAVAPEASPQIAAEFALTEAEYASRIAAIHEWIRAGDVYQLNFTAPFRVSRDARAASRRIYARLRARQPVDYGAFFTGNRAATFSRFRRSFSFASMATAKRGASSRGP